MTASNNGPVFTEAARERETFKYDALEISTSALRDPDGAKPIPSAVLSSTPDPGLTAFAQLGLYRLNGSRALVSLFDRKNQHIVAEAVRATPLNLNQDDVGQLWLCGTAVPRSTSICEHVLAGPAESLTIPGHATGNAPTDFPVSVVLDLDRDKRFCEVKDTQKRFYIGVPIRSPAGINIGVYCVFDDKPRQHVSPADIQFIRDMSRTIMDYLDTKRSHECYRREERMVRGLGSFVEGKATLSNWSLSSNPSSFQDLPGVQEGSLNKRLRGSNRASHKPNSADARTPSEVGDPTSEHAQAGERGRDVGTKFKPASGHTPRSSSADVLQGDVEGVFSKASNIIRESLEVAGVVYLDASIRTFGGLIGQEMASPTVLGKPSSDESSSDEIPSSHSADGAEASCCKVLGYSTSQTSSVNGDPAVSPLTTLPEKLLHYLLQRYPHGKIYNMEADVLPLSEYNASDLTLLRRKASEAPAPASSPRHAANGRTAKLKQRPTITSLLARLFPGARSVAFVPLWDSQRNRWFAGSFVWTRTPTRIFTPENELSYLKVYGLTIMAEVTRLHIKAADKTKMDVLGSISHELRSPLHGVVGAAELLRQTPLDGSQDKILRTIQISSRTLLDTIDHLLDYGKMSGLIKSTKASKAVPSNHSSRPRNHQDLSLAIPDSSQPPVQLDVLTEEVVESVLAGYGYLHTSDASSGGLDPGIENLESCWQAVKARESPADLSPGEHHRHAEDVQIHLDIEPAASWSFLIHPGAFRRIVMNLFGNSLKFTQRGYIRVHLRQEPHSGPDQPVPGVGKVLLTVTDSGKGISEEYLRNQLFTPFAQEDHFAPGTGLGLSLVRQVVTGLGGDIQVASQIGHGTSVTVSVPLPFGPATGEEGDIMGAAKADLAGLSIVLRSKGLTRSLQDRDLDPAAQDVDVQTATQLRNIETICSGWLGMRILSEAEAQHSTPDFVISIHDSSSELNAHSALNPACPHVIACQSPQAAQSIVGQRHFPPFVDILSQPLGPRKLARSLTDSRRLWMAAQRTPMAETGAADTRPDETQRTSGTRPQVIKRISESQDGEFFNEAASYVAAPVPPDSVVLPVRHHVDSTSAGARSHPTLVPSDIAMPAMDPRSILIVDDNIINRKILAALMKKLDQPHRTANNGLEALEKYKASPTEYSCILTDISMPVMDGLECARRAREFERATQLPPCKIITVTGLSGTLVRQDAFASGVDVFLTRPVSLKTVVETLDALGLRRESTSSGNVAG